MAKESLVASRTATVLPSASSTSKEQKGYQLPSEYDAQQVNQEFDRIHARINKIVVEGAALADLLTDGSETNANICLRINSIMSLLRQSGLLKSS